MTSVSIITPAYHAEKTIARAVRSVMAQTHEEWEMILVADDRQDYKALLQAQGITDPRLRFATTGEIGAGPGVARNVGLDVAQGEYITTLDADDEYHPHYLADVGMAAAVYGVAMVRLLYKLKPDGGKQFLLGADALPKGYCALAMLEDYITINGCSVTMFHRRFLKHRYFTVHYGEDFYFDVRFFDYLRVIPVLYEELYIYHYHESSLTTLEKSDEMFIVEYKKMLVEIEADETLSPRLKNNLLAMYHHRLFQNYLYLNAKRKGECADFFEFMAQHPEHFTSELSWGGILKQ